MTDKKNHPVEAPGRNVIQLPMGEHAKRERALDRSMGDLVDTIPDIQTRLIFRLRFLRCMTWDEVADTIGGRNTVSGVKKTCYRYLDAEKAKRKAEAGNYSNPRK